MTVVTPEDLRGGRLDVELVRRGLARSRRRAAEMVVDGQVRVDGVPARKPSQQVALRDELAVDASSDYVSRAAHKLHGALDQVEALVPGAVTVHGARCLDVGASTGGFTQVLLERGAAHVVAVDVGHGQLVPSLRQDGRVTALEGLNARVLSREHVGSPAPAIVVADLSFISLTLVAGPVAAVCARGADLLLMVKPQFEVGRERLGPGGVVTDPALRVESVVTVARTLAGHGCEVRAVIPSALPGESGNREYFLWCRAGRPATGDDDVRVAAEAAVLGDRAVLVGGAA
jgi:23S rRNA (cytidine1920-2'-O)/16S rRNA (cytidine1409-2'-O)-methyltransferase